MFASAVEAYRYKLRPPVSSDFYNPILALHILLYHETHVASSFTGSHGAKTKGTNTKFHDGQHKYGHMQKACCE